jgi:hypothetical protein
MRNRVLRAAFAAAGSLVLAAAVPSAALATDLSITTTYANIDWTVGSINGTIHYAGGPAGGEGAKVGRIRLVGTDQNNNAVSLPVYCVDVKDWLGNGTFTETTLDTLSFSATQLSNVVKFLTYVDSGPTPLVNSAVTSAAAQLGVWEILNETGSWGLTSGSFYVTQYDSASIFTAAALADTWLGTLATNTLTTHGNVLTVLDPGHGNQTQAFIRAGSEGTVTPGVPEPTTWAMIVLGFGVLGAALRRGKREDSLFA